MDGACTCACARVRSFVRSFGMHACVAKWVCACVFFVCTCLLDCVWVFSCGSGFVSVSVFLCAQVWFACECELVCASMCSHV